MSFVVFTFKNDDYATYKQTNYNQSVYFFCYWSYDAFLIAQHF